MNIGADIRTLSFRKGGISQYAYLLLKNLTRMDPGNRYFLFNFTKSPYEWDTFRRNVEEIVLRLPQRHGLHSLWENVLVPAAIKRYGIDLWFSPDFSIPKFANIPRIAAVHDLIFMHFHDPTSKYSKNLQTKVAYTIKHAAKIIVMSHYTLTDLRKAFPLDDAKVVVIPEAADERFHPIDKRFLPAVLNRYRIQFPYILFVGEISLRKNLSRLLTAFHLLKQDGKLSDRKLVIAGKRTTDTPRIERQVLRFDLLKDIVFTGYVPDEDLPFLYNGADLFVFPSLYEGFGIPPLEAMQCETPVVASNATSIPEIVGDGALLFDPHDPADMATKMDAVLNRRIDLDRLKSSAGERIQRFSWAVTAEKTMEAFNACNSSGADKKSFFVPFD